MQLVNKIGEALFESQSILVDAALEAHRLDNLKELPGNGLLRLVVAHQVQHLEHLLLVGVLVAAQQRVQRQGNNIAQVVVVVLHQLQKDKLKDGAEEGLKGLDHLLVLRRLNRRLESQFNDDLEAHRFDFIGNAVKNGEKMKMSNVS